jgi:hypothetical protein
MLNPTSSDACRIFASGRVYLIKPQMQGNRQATDAAVMRAAKVRQQLKPAGA